MGTEPTSATTGTESSGVEDHRSSLRRQYGYRQSIAPITDHGIPVFDELSEVECKDISGGGMSFYADFQPTYKRVLVSLGPSSNPQYFLAKVIHIARERSRGGERYVVGCRFIKRVYL